MSPMSINQNLDTLIGSLEKIAASGLTAGLSDAEGKVMMTDTGKVCPKCGTKLAKDAEECGCDKKKNRLVKGKVQEMAYCKKCRGKLGACECLRKEASCDCSHEGLCKDDKECGCDCSDRASCTHVSGTGPIAKSGLDLMIEVLSKQAK